MIKTILLISASVVAGMFFHSIITEGEPPLVTIDNWEQVDGERMITLNEHTTRIYEVRKELENSFQQALLDREVQCTNWEVCDCKDNVTIIESNCDTTELEATVIELEDTLEQCTDANKLLNTQLYNFIYQ